MANNIFEKYGIKEVADVTFYDTVTNEPVLFLDTLKVSTIEQTAEQVSARGGKGNPELIVWDYGKEITLNLEDALFSPQSMNLMLGGMNGDVLKNDLTSDTTKITSLTRMTKFEAPDVKTTSTAGTDGIPESIKESETWYNPSTMTKITEIDELVTILKQFKYAYCEKTYTSTGNETGTVSGRKIEINAANFPGTYRIVGETYARSSATGVDEYFQFEIPKAKMGAENTITLEAEGDPSVFNMTMKVLRPESGPMIILRQYSLTEAVVDPHSGTATIPVTISDSGSTTVGTATVQLGSSNLPVLNNIPSGKKVAGWYSDSELSTEFTVPTGGWTATNAQAITATSVYAKLEDE